MILFCQDNYLYYGNSELLMRSKSLDNSYEVGELRVTIITNQIGLLYKSNEKGNKSIACKCNKNATGYCPKKQPFETTRDNNGKVRQNGLYLFSYK